MMENINQGLVDSHLESVNDCVYVIMTVEKLLHEYTLKACDGEQVDGFVVGGLCKALSIACHNISHSVEQVREIV